MKKVSLSLKCIWKRDRQGINEVYELKLICKDGSPLWALISAKSLFNKGGKFIGSLGMFTDITSASKKSTGFADTTVFLRESTGSSAM